MSFKPFAIIFVFIIAGAVVVLAGQVVIDVKTIRDEARASSAGKRTSWIKIDRNKDGRDDHLLQLDERGQSLYEEMDYNFDGEFDDFCFYANGILAREEIDTNFDGKIDLWVHMYRGIYVERYERDKDFDGKRDLVKIFGKR